MDHPAEKSSIGDLTEINMALLSSDLLAWREDMSYFESDLTMEPGMFEDDLDNELIASLGSADLEMPFFESGNLFSTSFAATARQVLFGEEDVNNGSVEFAQFNLQPSAFSGFLALDAGFSHLDELQKDEDEEYYRTDEIDECNHVKTSFFRASPTSDLLLRVSDSLPASSTLAESKPSPRTPSTPSKSSRRSSEKKPPRKTTSKRSFIGLLIRLDSLPPFSPPRLVLSLFLFPLSVYGFLLFF